MTSASAAQAPVFIIMENIFCTYFFCEADRHEQKHADDLVFKIVSSQNVIEENLVVELGEDETSAGRLKFPTWKASTTK